MYKRIAFVLIVAALALEWMMPTPAFSEELQGEKYKLKDLKGPVFYAPLKGAKYEYWPGLYAFEVLPSVQPDVVPLFIEREFGTENNIRITWEASFGIPDIYVMTGLGDGVFTNSYNASVWKKIDSTGTEPGFVGPYIDTTIPEGWLLHTAQVGKGSPEAYYKALAAGTDPLAVNAATGNAIFEDAPAVGKVNVEVDRNDNNISFFSFSVPLVPKEGDDFHSVFPPDSFVSASQTGNLLTADQIREWTGTAWKSYFKSSVDDNWHETISPYSLAKHTFGKGYVLRLQKTSDAGGNKTVTVTVVGDVLPGQYVSSIAYGGDSALGTLGGAIKFSAFGNPFPKLSSLENAFSLNESDLQGATLNLLEADQVRNWDHLTGSWKSCYFDGTTWLMTDGKPAFDFNMNKGYVFRKADNSSKGAFIWKYQIQ